MPTGSRSHEVSVVIPTYNRRHLLSKALDSVFKQTTPAKEVIVVDDGSTDDTLSELPRTYPEAIWLTQDNLGVSRARNHGIQEARGEWIAFLDSDDTWHPQKLERQIDFLKKNPSLSICHTDEEWIRNAQKVKTPTYLDKTNHQLFIRSLNRCIICPSSVILNRSIFETTGYFDENLPVCEDYDLWLRILVENEIGYLSEVLVSKYGGHEDQLSRKHWGMDRFRVHSLKNLLIHSKLSTNQRISVLDTLIQKLNILAQGFAKHGKFEQSEEFLNEMKAFSRELLTYSTTQPLNS